MLITFVNCTFLLSTVQADESKELVTSENFRVRLVPPGASVTAAFGVLVASKDMQLIGASSPLAKDAELHTNSIKGGVMQMRRIDSIELPAGREVALQPGGLHIMLIGLESSVQEGDLVDLHLLFSSGESISIQAPVQPVKKMMKHNH